MTKQTSGLKTGKAGGINSEGKQFHGKTQNRVSANGSETQGVPNPLLGSECTGALSALRGQRKGEVSEDSQELFKRRRESSVKGRVGIYHESGLSDEIRKTRKSGEESKSSV